MTHQSHMLAAYALGGVVWLGLAASLGVYGQTKGYSFGRGFLLGLVTSPLVGWLVITMLPEKSEKPYKPPAEILLAIEQEKLKMKKAEAAEARERRRGH